jgi:hypothetical protein
MIRGASMSAIATEAPVRRMGRRKVYLPSPEEIQQACNAIQNTWSDEERRRRAVMLTPEEAQEQYVTIRTARVLISPRPFRHGDAA